MAPASLLQTSTLSVTTEDRVGVITFTRTKKFNSFTPELYQDIPKALGVCAQANEVSVVVMTALGPYYSTGQDLMAGQSLFAPEDGVEMSEHLT